MRRQGHVKRRSDQRSAANKGEVQQKRGRYCIGSEERAHDERETAKMERRTASGIFNSNLGRRVGACA